jgi:hypothetical protein
MGDAFMIDAGRYKAIITAGALEESQQSGIPVFVAQYKVTDKLMNNEWQWADGTITAWHYLEKKDGSVNENQVKQLQRTFGWNGSNVMDLEALENLPCQITVEAQEYNPNAGPMAEPHRRRGRGRYSAVQKFRDRPEDREQNELAATRLERRAACAAASRASGAATGTTHDGPTVRSCGHYGRESLVGIRAGLWAGRRERLVGIPVRTVRRNPQGPHHCCAMGHGAGYPANP